MSTGKLVRAFEGHTHHVLDVTWKADSSAIATAGADNAIKVWNTSTGDQNRTINKHTKEVTSIRFLGTGNDIVTCSGDKTVWLHRVDNGSSYRSFAGCPDYVYAATATRDMKTVIAAGEDGAVRVWDGTNGQLKQTWEPPAPAGDAQANAAK